MKKIRKIFQLILSCTFILIPQIAFAAGEEYTSFYKLNGRILENNNIISSALNSIGWFFTKGLTELGAIAQKLYDIAFGFIDLTDSEKVNSFVGEFKIAFIALSCMALLYLGIILIMQPKKKPNIAINICFAVLCVTCSTWLFGMMNDLAFGFKSGVDSIGGDTKITAVEIVDNNAYDILDLYNKHGAGLTTANAKTGANINDESINYIDVNEVIDYKADYLSGENPFKYKVKTFNGPNGKTITEEVSDGFLGTSIGNNLYYRYSFNYMSMFLQLISLLIVYLTLSYKCVRIAFELVVGRLLAYLYSAELSGGEKIRKIIVFIRDSYIMLAVSIICVKIYTIFTEYIGSNSNTQGLTGAVFSLFIAFAIIDGPNLVEKLLGMDAGLKSSTARMMAVGRATRAAALGTIHGAKKAGEGASKLAGFAKDKMSNGRNANSAGGRQAEDKMNAQFANGPNSENNADNKSNNNQNTNANRDESASSKFKNDEKSNADNKSNNNYDSFMDNKENADISSKNTDKDPNSFMTAGLQNKESDISKNIDEGLKNDLRNSNRDDHSFMSNGKSDSNKSGIDNKSTSMPKREHRSNSKAFTPDRSFKNNKEKLDNVKENYDRKHKK